MFLRLIIIGMCAICQSGCSYSGSTTGREACDCAIPVREFMRYMLPDVPMSVDDMNMVAAAYRYAIDSVRGDALGVRSVAIRVRAESEGEVLEHKISRDVPIVFVLEGAKARPSVDGWDLVLEAINVRRSDQGCAAVWIDWTRGASDGIAGGIDEYLLEKQRDGQWEVTAVRTIMIS